MPTIRTVFVAAVAFAAFAHPSAAFAQDNGERTVGQFTCKDVMRESGSQRDVAIAFLHGFFVGKSGASKFNLETLTEQTDAFVDRCLDNPNAAAVDAMATVKSN